MRASVAVSTVALFLTAGAVWYFGPMPFRPGSGHSSMPGSGPLATGNRVTELAPNDLPGLAAFLAKVPFDQRAQFIREKVAPLSADQAADREKIRTFLRTGADVDIERPTLHPTRLSSGNTTLRRYLLGLLVKFPPAEGVPLAKEVLAQASDFRELYLCLQALEQFQPDANRHDALAAMQKTLAAAAHPARSGPEVEAYVSQYDRFAEPLAQYSLAELHPEALRVVQANPMLAGRYTEAVVTYPTGQQTAAYNDLFANPAVAQELVNASGTRSADVWLDPTFRQNAARLFASSMSNSQRADFINGLAEDGGLHFVAKPLAQPAQPQLQPLDPARDTEQAKARLAMLDAVASQATTPETKAAVDSTRSAIQAEIADNATPARRRLSPIDLSAPNPFGDPAEIIDQPKATTGHSTTPPPTTDGATPPATGGN